MLLHMPLDGATSQLLTTFIYLCRLDDQSVIDLLHLMRAILLRCQFHYPRLEIACNSGFLGSWHEPRGFRKQRIHLLQRPLLRLRHESPKEDRISEIANDEGKEVSPAHLRDCRRSNLPNEGVECE